MTTTPTADDAASVSEKTAEALHSIRNYFASVGLHNRVDQVESVRSRISAQQTEIDRLRAELTEARRQLAAQPAVPEAVAKDAERYRLIERHKDFAILYCANATDSPKARFWDELGNRELRQHVDAILSATDSEVKK